MMVKKQELFGLIDKTGAMVLPCEYSYIGQPFHSGYDDSCRHEVLELIDQCDRHWLADKNGRIVTSRGYKEIGESDYMHDLYSNMSWNGFIGLFDVNEKGYYMSGLFDMVNVREVVPAIYYPGAPSITEIRGVDSIGIRVVDYQDGEARCKLVSASGKDLIPFEEGFTYIGDPQSDDYLIVAERDGKMGYINIHGTVKIPFRYDSAGDFVDGCSVVGFATDDAIRYQYGVIGHHGKLLIPFVFGYEVPDVRVDDGKVIAEGLSKDHSPLRMEAEMK